MKKIIFVFIRLFGSATVVAFTYLNFNLPAEYLAVIGILTYALIDFLGRPAITFLLALKNLKSFRKAFVYTISKKPDKVKIKKTVVTKVSETKIESFFSFDRKLDFLVYFDAPKGSAYQLLMWIPYLYALRKNFLVVLRKNDHAKTLQEHAIPFIVLPKLKDLERLSGLGIKTIFYVNNGMRNTHLIRYNEFTHIQLLHGDSDKPASFNPVSSMYNYLFVAGELAIDRYKNNNVIIPKERFVIVSRPQGELFKIINDPSELYLKPIKTVLYTTTWQGYQNSTNFSSIDSAKDIIEHLVSSNFRVIFRPHPLSYTDKGQAIIIDEIKDYLLEQINNTGIAHCISDHKEFSNSYKSVEECINGSDILLSDVSAIIGDWLFTAKPYILLDMNSNKDEFYKLNPLAKGAYYLDEGIETLSNLMESICTSDPAWDNRLLTRKYALGIALDDDPVEHFLKNTKQILEKDEIWHLSQEEISKRQDEDKTINK